MYTKILFGFCFIYSFASFAQVEIASDLFKSMEKLDHQVFEEGFNQCQLKKLASIIDEDLEFYHDVGGFQNKAEFIQAMQNNICADSAKKPIRKLVKGSMKVFELKNNGILYGAIQQGVHEFYIKEGDKELYKTGIARFSSLWLISNQQWLLKTVFSYDHKAASGD